MMELIITKNTHDSVYEWNKNVSHFYTSNFLSSLLFNIHNYIWIFQIWLEQKRIYSHADCIRLSGGNATVQLCVLLHPGVTNVFANPLPEEIMYTATHILGPNLQTY